MQPSRETTVGCFHFRISVCEFNTGSVRIFHFQIIATTLQPIHHYSDGFESGSFLLTFRRKENDYIRHSGDSGSRG